VSNSITRGCLSGLFAPTARVAWDSEIEESLGIERVRYVNILVAGGAGFIGSVLVPSLIDRGHRVTVADAFWFGRSLPENVETIDGDLFSLTPNELARFDQVIFLAGLSNDPMAEFSPVRNFIDNGALPSYLAYASKLAGVKRFVYASSCSVYGFTGGDEASEDTAVHCGYPYGISKLQGERGVLQLGDGDFSTIALRQGTVVGHSPRMRFDLIVNTMFKTAVSTGRIVINNPDIWRPIIDVRDTATAFRLAVEAPPETNGVFNVAFDNFTVGDVGNQVASALEDRLSRPITLEILRNEDLRSYRVSTVRAREQLGFTPTRSIPETIDELLTHADEYGDFSKDAFYNIEIFKQIER